MGSREFDAEEVAHIYDELLTTYRKQWEYQGHKSLHLGYYDDDHTDAGPAAMNTMRVLSEAAGVGEGDRVLNIGCGAGEDSVWNARAHGATVIGVNISESQLEIARENARVHGVGDVTEFRYDDFHELETVADGSVDVVWGLEALSHSPDRARVLAQARRVLDDGGRVAFTDIFLRPNREFTPEQRQRIAAVDEALGIHVGRIDEFEETLETGGFTNVRIRNMTEGIRPSTKRRRQFARVASPVGKALGKIGKFSDVHLAALQANATIHELVEEGVIGYYLITADLAAEQSNVEGHDDADADEVRDTLDEAREADAGEAGGANTDGVGDAVEDGGERSS